jgi:hypothetical protein
LQWDAPGSFGATLEIRHACQNGWLPLAHFKGNSGCFLGECARAWRSLVAKIGRALMMGGGRVGHVTKRARRFGEPARSSSARLCRFTFARLAELAAIGAAHFEHVNKADDPTCKRMSESRSSGELRIGSHVECELPA